MSISDSLIQGLSSPVAVSQVPEDLVPYTEAANPFLAAHEAKYKQLKMLQDLAARKEQQMLEKLEDSKYQISPAIKTSSLSPYRRALLTKVANPPTERVVQDTTQGPTGTGAQGPTNSTTSGPVTTQPSVQVPSPEEIDSNKSYLSMGQSLRQDILDLLTDDTIPKQEDLEAMDFDELKRRRDVYKNKSGVSANGKDLPKDPRKRRPISLMEAAKSPYNQKMFEAYRDAAEKKFRSRRFAGMSPDRLRFYKDQLGGFFSPERKNLKDYKFDEAIEAGDAAEAYAKLMAGRELKLDDKIDATTGKGFSQQWTNAIQVPEARLTKLDELSKQPGYTRIPRDLRQQLDAEHKRLQNYVESMYNKSENLRKEEDAAIIAGATMDPSTGSVPGVNYGGGTFTAKETQSITQPTAYRKAKNQLGNTATQGPSNIGASGPTGQLPSGPIGPGSTSPTNQTIPPEVSVRPSESRPLTQGPQGSRTPTGKLQVKREPQEELNKFKKITIPGFTDTQPTTTDQGPTGSGSEGPTGTVVPNQKGTLAVVPPSQAGTQGPTSTTPPVSKTQAPVTSPQVGTQGPIVPTATPAPNSTLNLGVKGPTASGGGPTLQVSKSISGNLPILPTKKELTKEQLRLREILQSQNARRQFPGRAGRRYDEGQDWKAYFGRKYQGLKDSASDFLTDVDRVSTRLLRPITVGTQDLVSDAANRFELVRNMLGEDSLRDLNKELYFATGSDEYRDRLGKDVELENTRAEYIDNLRKQRMADYDYNRFVPTNKKELERYNKDRDAYEADVVEGLENYFGAEGNRLGLEDIRTDSPYRDALGYTQNMFSDPKKYLAQAKDYFTDTYEALPSPGDYYESLDDDNPLLALFGDDERTSVSSIEKVLQNPRALEALAQQFGTTDPAEIESLIQRGLAPNASPGDRLRAQKAMVTIAGGDDPKKRVYDPSLRDADTNQMPMQFMDAVADIESGLGELQVPVMTLDGDSKGNFDQFTNNVFSMYDQLNSDRIPEQVKKQIEAKLNQQLDAITPQQAKLILDKIKRYQFMQGSGAPIELEDTPGHSFGKFFDKYTPELFLTDTRKPIVNFTDFQGHSEGINPPAPQQPSTQP